VHVSRASGSKRSPITIRWLPPPRSDHQRRPCLRKRCGQRPGKSVALPHVRPDHFLRVARALSTIFCGLQRTLCGSACADGASLSTRLAMDHLLGVSSQPTELIRKATAGNLSHWSAMVPGLKPQTQAARVTDRPSRSRESPASRNRTVQGAQAPHATPYGFAALNISVPQFLLASRSKSMKLSFSGVISVSAKTMRHLTQPCMRAGTVNDDGNR